MLIGADVHVKIIENNPQRSEQLAQMLPEAAIICADGANQEILEAEGLNETDALVTLTGIDEQNIITSMVGNAKGVPHIVTKVNRIMTTGMVETLPIGSVVSPKELCSANIVQYVRAMQHQTGAAVTLHRIADGRAEALEFIVNKQSKYIGEPLKNLRLRLKKKYSDLLHHTPRQHGHSGRRIVLSARRYRHRRHHARAAGFAVQRHFCVKERLHNEC